MLAPIEFGQATRIVEFGPGTGPFTAEIGARLKPGDRYLGIEINPAFCDALRRRFPDLAFVCDSAERLSAIAATHGIAPIDAIVCGLPWASLPLDVQARIFAEMRGCLRPGGLFVTFAYLQGVLLPGARALRRRLAAEFDSMTRGAIVWRNIPPAFTYICRR